MENRKLKVVRNFAPKGSEQFEMTVVELMTYAVLDDRGQLECLEETVDHLQHVVARLIEHLELSDKDILQITGADTYFRER